MIKYIRILYESTNWEYVKVKELSTKNRPLMDLHVCVQKHNDIIPRKQQTECV